MSITPDQEPRNASNQDRYYEMIAQASRQSCGLPPDPKIFPLETFEVEGYPEPKTISEIMLLVLNLPSVIIQSGECDKILCAGIRSSRVDTNVKTRAIDMLAGYFFRKDSEEIDQQRAGPFMKTLVDLYEDSDTEAEIIHLIDRLFTGELLERIALEAARNRWQMEHAEAAARVYCSIGTLEKIFDKYKALEMQRLIAQQLLFARALEEELVNTFIAGGEKIRGGINLSPLGHEVAQIGLRTGTRITAEELCVNERYWPYYRSRYLIMGDQHKGFMSADDIVAELFRLGEASGNDLPLFGPTFFLDPETGEEIMRIYRGLANVGFNLVPSAGATTRLRQEAITKEGIEYYEPQRASVFREIQLEGLTDMMIATFGDGAWPELASALEYAQAQNTPLILVCENNGLAIGTELSDVLANTNIHQKGRGAGTAGVRIGSLDAKGMILAGRWATLWTSRDAGPFFLEFMTERLASHSVQHGHHVIAEISEQAQTILQEQLNRWQGKNHQVKAVREFMNDGLFSKRMGDRTIDVRARLLHFIQEVALDDGIRNRLQDLIDTVVDPMAVVLNNWQEDGVFTQNEADDWKKEAEQQATQVLDRVKQRELPDPEVAVARTRYPIPYIITNGSVERVQERGHPVVKLPYSDARLTMTGAQAQRNAIIRTRGDNSRFVGAGVDIFCGKEARRNDQGRWIIGGKGGYFHQWDKFWEEFGHIPGAMWPLPISEDYNAAWGFGFVAQPSSMIDQDFEIQTALLRGKIKPRDINPNRLLWRMLMDGEYGDYMIHSLKSLMALTGLGELSNGQIVCPIGFIFPCGWVPTGGAQHSNNYEAAVYQAPASMEIYTAPTPRILYELINYLTRFGNNPYAIFLDKLMYNQEETWVEGTGLFEPGHDNIVYQGGDIQVITWGSMSKFVRQAIGFLEGQYNDSVSIGLLEKVSWRPFGEEDLKSFLSSSRGPILLVTEEFKSRSLANQLYTELGENQCLAPLVSGLGRTVSIIAPPDRSYPPCDPILMATARPGVDELASVFQKALNRELPKTKIESLRNKSL